MIPRRLLAVETATRALSVAVLEGGGGRVLAEVEEAEDPRPHSERLLPAVDAALARAGVPLAAVEAFAVSIGPGSFTGLRIGLATLKGFAFNTSLPVAAVPTLAVLAAQAEAPESPVAALLDARRGEVYAAAWPSPAAAQTGALPEVEESVWRPEALAARLHAGTVLMTGEDAGPAARELAARVRDARVVEGPAARPRAAFVGRLGLALLAAGEGVPAERLVPRYLRRAEAEARRTGLPLEG